MKNLHRIEPPARLIEMNQSHGRTLDQLRCDSIVAGYRGAIAAVAAEPAETVPPAPTSDPLRLQIAAELEEARARLEAMGSELAADPLVVLSHSVTLQSVDILAQTLQQIASVVGSDQPGDVVQGIGMAALKRRLAAALAD